MATGDGGPKIRELKEGEDIDDVDDYDDDVEDESILERIQVSGYLNKILNRLKRKDNLIN